MSGASKIDETEGEATAAAEREPEPEHDAEALERRRVALSQVVKFGDPVLRSRATEVTEFDQSLRDEAARMIELMRDGMGVGLAATQVGALRRLLVFQAGPDAEARALVNPELEWISEETEIAE
ncbi:MAG TPA: peptide deformylase, partial [Solirubrobacterales bacterium]|nr:peptide deformylase [Solirubrobacterales bacterium]